MTDVVLVIQTTEKGQTLLTSVCDMWKMWFQINSKNLQLNLYKNI